ncbi:hypothetical protein DICVIV_14457, partial [Dictyocaulus viviparus]
QGINTFYCGNIMNTCDTCYQKVVKCAPVPLKPGPPPFCECDAISTRKDREIGEQLDFPRKYKKDKAGESFTTDEVEMVIHTISKHAEKNRLCTEYHGMQFPARCFPAPSAPEPKSGKTKNSNDESNIADVIEGTLRKNSQFAILEKYALTPNTGIQFLGGKDYSITHFTEDNEIKPTKLELDYMGLLKTEVKYMKAKNQENSQSKMTLPF